MKTKINLFYKHEYKNKIKLFSNNKLKFQPRTLKKRLCYNCSIQ